jgi:hypothetical protein
VVNHPVDFGGVHIGAVSMSVPKKVKVNHIVYPIKIVSQEHLHEMDGDTESRILGMTDYVDIWIKLADDNPHIQNQKTLLHEIIHCIDMAAGMTLQESEVKMLAIGLHGVMKDNPKIKEFIFG